MTEHKALITKHRDGSWTFACACGEAAPNDHGTYDYGMSWVLRHIPTSH
jgi:hypothetical protein